jgi:ABC-type Mn2+/Zn2+ transport system permease subunit
MAGLTLSFHLDTPTGPTIVVCVTGIFVFSNLIMLVQHRL